MKKTKAASKGKKVTESKFVQKIEKKEAQLVTQGERGYTPFISKSDLVVPRIQLMQSMSAKVAIDGTAKAGELRENLINELIADVGEQVSIIPVHAESIWLIRKEKQVGKKREQVFVGVEKIGPENEFAPYEEETEDGWMLVRTKQIEVYALLEKDPTMPFIISFAKTSHKAGKKMLTQMYMKNAASGLDPSAVKMWVASKQEQGEQGAYHVLDVGFEGYSSDEQIAAALKWYKSITNGQIKTEVQDAD